MFNRYIIVALSAMVALSSCCGSKSANEIIACGDSSVIIFDHQRTTPDSLAVVWQWSAAEAKDQLPAEYQQYLRTIDDCKPYQGGEKLLITSSSSATLLLERSTKKIMFYANTPNAHSAEMLPNDRIMVALSTAERGNRLNLYNIATSDSVIWSDSLYSGHGVVWNASRERLYTLGYDELREYSLVNWESDKPSLKLEKRHTIPQDGGHDLVAIDDNELLITAHNGVNRFNIESGVFTPFEPLADLHNVKSTNYDPVTKHLVYTKAEESWWTHNIYFENPSKVVNIDYVDLYKARVIK